ncbi:MAG: hypothetical protein WAQ24_04935 [Candidatus Saccharimonadales bacterium]
MTEENSPSPNRPSGQPYEGADSAGAHDPQANIAPLGPSRLAEGEVALGAGSAALGHEVAVDLPNAKPSEPKKEPFLSDEIYNRFEAITRGDIEKLDEKDRQRLEEADNWLEGHLQAKVFNNPDPWDGRKTLKVTWRLEEAETIPPDISDIVLLRLFKQAYKVPVPPNMGEDESGLKGLEPMSSNADKAEFSGCDVTGLLTDLPVATEVDSNVARYILSDGVYQLVLKNRGVFPTLKLDEHFKEALIEEGCIGIVLENRQAFTDDGAQVDGAFARKIFDKGGLDAAMVLQNSADYPDLSLNTEDIINYGRTLPADTRGGIIPYLKNLPSVICNERLFGLFTSNVSLSAEALQTNLFNGLPADLATTLIEQRKSVWGREAMVQAILEHSSAFLGINNPESYKNILSSGDLQSLNMKNMPIEIQATGFEYFFEKGSLYNVQDFSALPESCLNELLRSGKIERYLSSGQSIDEFCALFTGLDEDRRASVVSLLTDFAQLSQKAYREVPQESVMNIVNAYRALVPDVDQDNLFEEVSHRNRGLISLFDNLGERTLKELISSGYIDLLRPQYFGALDSSATAIVRALSETGLSHRKHTLDDFLTKTNGELSQRLEDDMAGNRYETLKRLVDGGLFNIVGNDFDESGGVNNVKEAIIGIILRNADPESSLKQISRLIDDGVLLIGGGRRTSLYMSILSSDRRNELYEQWREVEKQGVFELGGEEYNGFVLDYIMKSEDIAGRFSIISSCAEHGLFTIEDRDVKHVVVSYVFDSEDPTNAMAQVRELSDMGLFNLEPVFSQKIIKRVFGSHDPIGEYTIIKDLAAEGLFNLGESNNTLLVNFVFRAEDMRKAFIDAKTMAESGILSVVPQSIKFLLITHVMKTEDIQETCSKIFSLIDQGLLELGGEYNEEMIAHVLLSDDPTAAYIQLKDLVDDGLLTLVQPSNGLGAMGIRLVRMCIADESPRKMLARIKQAFGGGQKSLWWLNTQYAELLLGEVKNGATTQYMVSGVPTALPLASRDKVEEGDTIAFKLFADMTVEEKQMWIAPDALAGDPGLLSRPEIPFGLLSKETHSTLLAYRLFKSIALSRSVEQLDQATLRNKAYAEHRSPLELGDLVHATSTVQSFRNILLSGILCGETLGTNSRKDSYPYNVDTVVVSQAVAQAGGFSEQVGALQNRSFGSICLIMHRTPDSTDFGRETIGGFEDHRLVFGAIPATEINAIVLRGAEPALRDEVINSVIEHGMYVPVYDDAETLLLTYQDYAKRRDDGNYDAVQPEVVDGTFKLDDSQGGSNEGAWYIMPTATGRERWYVKYGDSSPQKAKHLWTELLADQFYRAVTPQLVSETKPVIIDGRLARASKEVILDVGSSVTDAARNAGFVMDCLLGNWDAVYNGANLVMSKDGHAMRIDTGNSFDFRAQGEQKDADSFGPVVSEVELGTNGKRLGGGMRQMYPGLTDEDIVQQVRSLQTNLPPKKIDVLIDGIRRPKAERERLKKILNARRQYLIDTFLA